MKKDNFKEFIRKNPKLINYVRKGEMTWQQFYEMYDIYGEENEIWNDYIKPKEEVIIKKEENKGAATLGALSLSEVVNWIKNVNLDSIQEGIGNMQRVLGVVQDFSKENKMVKETNTYKPRPLYKHFED